MKKVLIVEDEPLIAEDLSDILTQLNYEVVGIAESFEEVKEILAKGVLFDIVLQDVQIVGDVDGIEVAEYIKQHTAAKTVFLTSFSDDVTIKRIRSVQPAGYIVKPYKEQDIKTTLALLTNPLNENVTTAHNGSVEPEKQFILVKDSLDYVKLAVDKILYLEAADNYCKVITADKKFLLSLTLKAALSKLPEQVFKRCHRSYAVNINEIERVGATYVVVKGNEIPFNEAFKKEVTDLFERF